MNDLQPPQSSVPCNLSPVTFTRHLSLPTALVVTRQQFLVMGKTSIWISEE